MAFKKIFILPVLSLLLILSSCMSSKRMYRELTSKPASLDYLIEDPVSVSKNSKSIYLEIDTSNSYSPGPGMVRKEKSYFLPLIFYWKTYQRHAYSLGFSGIKESPQDFLYEGFKREAERKCLFNITQNKDSADYIVVLQLDKQKANILRIAEEHQVCIPIGPYVVWITNYVNKLEEGEATCTINCRIYDPKTGEIQSESYSSIYELPDYPDMKLLYPLMYRFSSINASMVEGLGEAYRNNFLAILEDLNKLDEPALTHEEIMRGIE